MTPVKKLSHNKGYRPGEQGRRADAGVDVLIDAALLLKGRNAIEVAVFSHPKLLLQACPMEVGTRYLVSIQSAYRHALLFSGRSVPGNYVIELFWPGEWTRWLSDACEVTRAIEELTAS